MGRDRLSILHRHCAKSLDRNAMVAEIVRLNSAGLAKTEIAARLGIHRQTVLRWVARVTPSAIRCRHCSPSTRDAGVKLYQAGVTMAEIARRLGCSRRSVARWARAAERAMNTGPRLGRTRRSRHGFYD